MKIDTILRRPMAWALAAALGLGGLALAAADHLGALNPPATFKYASADEPAAHAGFAPVVKRVLPAVVNISSTKVIKTSGQMNPQMDPMFRQFFGDDSPFGGGRQSAPRSQREQGLGSGVIVSPEGYILTNNHVVDGATDVRVTLSDKREFKARVVGTDAKTDIAVLKIDADSLPSLVIGNSNKLEVGDYVLAIGNPFGLGGTVTMGIVSATGRSNLGIEQYEDFIQTDAPINPGNSGGALVNDRGELVGINTAILANGSEGNQGIGFAVPLSVARNVMDQILHNGKVVRAYLGVMSEPVTPALAKAFHADRVGGALVSSVSPDSPAAHAGIEKGDIILAVDGQPVVDSAQLAMHISLMQPGTDVTVKVLRDGSERTVNAKLAELPTETAKLDRPDHETDRALDGVSVENVTARTARQLGLPETASGVVVTQIDPSSEAADSGLRRGDLIQEVNRKPVRNVEDFQNALRNSKDQTLLLVNRDGNSLYLAV
ncbi:MAG: DegQ family serine endoprotease [Bryobacteraceae bacterium]|jgi:serine protease Do